MNFQRLQKSGALFLLCCCLLFACSPQCDEEIEKVFRAAETGKLGTLRAFLEEGGDPMLHCTDYRSGGKGIWPDRYLGQGVHFLYHSVQDALSAELMDLYLKYEVPQDVRDEMVADALRFLPEGKEGIIRIMFKHGAHLSAFPSNYNIFEDDRKALSRAKGLGYDLNWQDPQDQGNTLLMKYAQLDLYSTKAKAIEILETSLEEQEEFQERLKRKDERVQELIQTLELLLELGAQPDIKNRGGETAADLAFHEEVKIFLQKQQTP